MTFSRGAAAFSHYISRVKLIFLATATRQISYRLKLLVAEDLPGAKGASSFSVGRGASTQSAAVRNHVHCDESYVQGFISCFTINNGGEATYLYLNLNVALMCCGCR